MQTKIQKRFLVSEIIASELAALNSFYYEGNTCHGESIGWQILLRLFMWGRDIFSYPIALTMITNYARSGLAQIWTLLVPVHHCS